MIRHDVGGSYLFFLNLNNFLYWLISREKKTGNKLLMVIKKIWFDTQDWERKYYKYAPTVKETQKLPKTNFPYMKKNNIHKRTIHVSNVTRILTFFLTIKIGKQRKVPTQERQGFSKLNPKNHVQDQRVVTLRSFWLSFEVLP